MRTLVDTRAGRLEGDDRGGVLVFKGVPYAQPPVGELRFQPPQPALPWRGVRSARAFGAGAPQMSAASAFVRLLGAARGSQSEDCLFLNVWTPACDTAKRPVMVWIHGGAFVLGSGSMGLYSGSRFARRGDVVVVTINYRLGALGFLDLSSFGGDAADVSNLGIRDQVAALAWVRDNIEQFGGDPDNVTIFGESAGAMSVGTLLGTPSARGLFHRAILQSGAANNVSSADKALRVTETFLEEIAADPARLLARPDEFPLARILEAQQRTTVRMGIRHGTLPWQPSVDARFLPAQPLDALGELAAHVPVLIGTNKEEWKLFTLADRGQRRLDEGGLRARFDRALPGKDAAGTPRAEIAMDHYSRQRSSRGRPLSPGTLWACMQTDRVFRAPAIALADGHSDVSSAGTFAYRFDWRPPLATGMIGACHALEIPFVFGTLRAPVVRQLLGNTRSARELSRTMQQAWIAFARDGDPNHATMPRWPVYERETSRTMIFAGDVRVEPGPAETDRAFWSAAFDAA